VAYDIRNQELSHHAYDITAESSGDPWTWKSSIGKSESVIAAQARYSSAGELRYAVEVEEDGVGFVAVFGQEMDVKPMLEEGDAPVDEPAPDPRLGDGNGWYHDTNADASNRMHADDESEGTRAYLEPYRAS